MPIAPFLPEMRFTLKLEMGTSGTVSNVVRTVRSFGIVISPVRSMLMSRPSPCPSVRCPRDHAATSGTAASGVTTLKEKLSSM